MSTEKTKATEGSPNRDPITGEKGAHPIGTGVGAASAGAAGMAIGAVAGPLGAAVGAVVGAVAGGLAGKGVAESIDPTVEDSYWRENYKSRPYYEKATPYDTYAPAYQYGWESHSKYAGKSFDDVEGELGRDWSKAKASSSLDWERARHASRDAWERVGGLAHQEPRKDI